MRIASGRARNLSGTPILRLRLIASAVRAGISFAMVDPQKGNRGGPEMIKRTLAYCFAVLMSAGLYGGCNETVTAMDCGAQCQDVDNDCVKKCNDDQCRTQCQTDLDNCSASCSTITVGPKDGG
jgi:hypothetical protein